MKRLQLVSTIPAHTQKKISPPCEFVMVMNDLQNSEQLPIIMNVTLISSTVVNVSLPSEVVES